MPTEILLPTAIGAHGDEWARTGGSSKFNAVDPGDPISHDDMTSRLHHAQNNRHQSMAFENLSTKVPSAKTVVSMTFMIRLRNQDGNPTQSMGIRSANSTILAFEIAFAIQVPESTSFFDFGEQLAPADGGDWTVAKADDVQMDWILNGSMPENGLLSCTSVWIIAEYGEVVATVEPPDETARRMLRRFRFPEEIYRLQLGSRGEQIELWKDFRLVEAFGPEETGLGFGPEEWESRLLRCIRKTVDPKTGGVAVEAIDVRRYLTTFFLQAISDAPGKTTGTIRMDQGIVETFTRASKAWIEWSDGKAYEVASGEKKHNHLGLLCENRRTNRILNSAFDVDGAGGADVFASWSELLSAAGISAPTTNPYFADVDVSKQHLKITNTSPYAARGLNQTTAFSFGSSSWVTLSIVHEDSSGEQLAIVVINSTTGNALQSDFSWAAGDRITPWANRATRTRDSISFQMESTTGTLLIGLRNNIANGVVEVWQVDLRGGELFPNASNYATSPIVTYGSEVLETQDEVKYTNPLNQEAIPFEGDQFTIQAIIRTEYDSDVDLGVTTVNQSRTVFLEQASDADIGLLFKEDTGSGDNAFMMQDDGVFQFEAGKLKPTFLAGEELKIVYRRSSSRGEHDLGANKDHLMILEPGGDWIETEQINGAISEITTTHLFRLGYEFSDAFGDGGQLDGYIQYFDIRPFVLSKEEAKDFP